MSSERLLYSCDRCPAYCCSYPRIVVNKTDVKRLAKYFGLTVEKVYKRFTKKGHDKGEVVLRHRKDEHFGTACRFLDPETRRCTVYKARPKICRDFPGTVRCGYYEFLKFERRAMEDPDYVATTNNE
ncbi:MAG TPA: YkgJ family cysteine cluster protein [Kiloniellales bacterium]